MSPRRVYVVVSLGFAAAAGLWWASQSRLWAQQAGTAEPPAAPAAAAEPDAAAAPGCTGEPFPVPPVLSGDLPEDVQCLGAEDPGCSVQGEPQTPVEARPFFDNFSWQTFVALSWPSDPKDRGQPLSPGDLTVFEKPPAGSLPVWLSYRTADDLFDTAAPPPWDGAGGAANPCDPAGGHVFQMLTKSGTVFGDSDVNEAFSYPLIDQNRNYAYYDVQFNEVQYEFIREDELYLVQKLAAAEPVTMPESVPGGEPPEADGSIMVKTAWRQLTDDDREERYFTIPAQIVVPDEDGAKSEDGLAYTCVPATMGLVGIHLVRKVDGFGPWIWSTFEQVDNVELPPHAPAGTEISFNNGTDTPKTEGGWADRPPSKSPDLQPKDERVPVQVTRYNPMPDTPANCSTLGLNAVYQAALAETGTPWQYYKLIATQWPSRPDDFKLKEDGGIYPDNCGGAFPANGVVNTAAETYVQSPADAAGAGGNSCMSCHYGAGQADFSWVLQLRAHQAAPAEEPPGKAAGG
jgi:hypothetical protein